MTFPWPEPMPSGLIPVQSALERVTTVIGVASGLAATGRVVDLSGLESDAGRLCAQVLDLPPAQGRLLRAPLTELRDKMAALAELIQVRS